MQRCTPVLIALVACGDAPPTDEPTTTDATSTMTTVGSESTGGPTGDPGGETSSEGGSTSDGGAVGSEDGTSSGSSSGEATTFTFTCTHVIGYSQVNQWYNTGGVFESVVDDQRWQLRWNGGGGVDLWQDPGYTGWDNAIESPCAEGSDAPDRVLLSVSGPYGDDEEAWAGAIEATVATIRDVHPSAVQIVLQPVVGGPNHATCTAGDQDIRASWQHAHIDAAIANVVGGDVVAGASPEVGDCSEYADALGHLTDEGAAAAGQAIGEYYQ